jgi:hypothetical protein
LRRYGILRCDRLWFRLVHPLEIFAADERKLIVRVVRFEQEEAFTTGSRVSFLSILCCFGLAGCGPSPATSAGVIPRPIVTTTPPLGSPSNPALYGIEHLESRNDKLQQQLSPPRCEGCTLAGRATNLMSSFSLLGA